MRPSLVVPLLVFVPLVPLSPCPLVMATGDWPQFRGPTGEGHADEKLVTQWSDTKNVLWKVDVAGSGWSSPVVVGGKVYLTAAVPVKGSKNQSLRALCLGAKDGKVVWDVEVFEQDARESPAIHSKNSHASPTPIVEGERLYVHFGHQGTACLDLSGKVLWRNNELKYVPIHGAGGSPVLVDGLLVFSNDGLTVGRKDVPVRRMVALDA